MVGLDRKLALRRLFKLDNMNVVFLQETLRDGESINLILKSILLDWTVHTLDVKGMSGGCSIGFNSKTMKI